ncbi:MAG: hypothetical protein ISR65_20910 [Bacteriovoracaceae bacterium]|nr:hypothetical protein [Bacteriovoracaceae bacterium]
MKINLKNCTEEELWKYVATHLKAKGIDTILVGGAVVSIYSEGIYKSGDLDFVLGSMFTKGLPEAMKGIGFIQHGRHYIHPECDHLFVEFPGSFPLGIGEDYPIQPDEKEVHGNIIKILSPTDCVKDRLATYMYFKDRDGLDQAVLVSKKQPVNMGSIEKWCKGENHVEVFKEFIKLMKNEHSP